MDTINDQKQLEGKTIVGVKILSKDGVVLFFDDESRAHIDMGNGEIKYMCKGREEARP
ncbi:MAG: hypothetical protein JG770_1995 [Mahella sp.]|jgi:hypothetical protein|nr:hypothetical protein [Mahella sp.]